MSHYLSICYDKLWVSSYSRARIVLSTKSWPVAAASNSGRGGKTATTALSGVFSVTAPRDSKIKKAVAGTPRQRQQKQQKRQRLRKRQPFQFWAGREALLNFSYKRPAPGSSTAMSQREIQTVSSDTPLLRVAPKRAGS